MPAEEKMKIIDFHGVDKSIYTVVAGILLFLIILLSLNLFFQYTNYSYGIEKSLEGDTSVNHPIILTYSRAWDFAVVKTSSLFLSFLLIFTGALYVLRAGQTSFELSGEHGGAKGTIQISSPGIILACLGVGLVCFTLLNKSEINLTTDTPTVARIDATSPEKIQE